MPRFAANLTLLFREYPMMERFRAAREAGFDAVEVLFPYEHPLPAMRAALRLNELALALINCPPPNRTGEECGYAAMPGLAERFRHDFRRTMRVAKALRPAHVHVMAGRAEGAVAQATFIDNLQWAADQAPEQSLTIEPINTGDMPGYFLADFDLATEILDAVDRPNVNLQFDTYHAQMITGDMPATWKRHRERVVHVQVGGPPERHEPSTGEIDHAAFFRQLDAEGYGGFVSGEYHPRGHTEEGLGWIAMP